MKVAFFSESSIRGNIPRDFSNARTEYAWMIALNANHWNIDVFSKPKEMPQYDVYYDLGIIIIPKNNPQIDLSIFKDSCKNVAIMQEGPHWYFQDYSIDKQFHYYNALMEADWVYCHNKSDVSYYRGLGCKDVRVMRSLMIPEELESRTVRNRDNVIIGGNFVSWYGGFDSYIVARELDRNIWAPSMGRKQQQEDAIEDINYLPYMTWREWINKLKDFDIGIHLMRTHAAGTFAMNCAYHNIPCIGYKGLDTQEILHPLITIEVGDLERAKKLALRLQNDEKFYKLCSDTTKKQFKKHYIEEVWLENWKEIWKKLHL